MEHRLGFVVSSIDELAKRLSAYLAREKNIKDFYWGQVDPASEALTILGRDDDMGELIDKWMMRKNLGKLVGLWVRGFNFDWNRLYGSTKPRRISLPTYPFARERYWITEVPAREDADSQLKFDRNMESIERLINSIGDDTVETDEAVRALKLLV